MKGFSRANLMYMWAFAEAWPDFQIVQQAVGQLPWGHNLVLLTKIKSAETRVDVDAPAPTFPQKRADALVAMADLAMSALAADGKPACAADKYQVIVHIDADRMAYVSAETSAQRC